MRVVVAPDKFAGTLTAPQAAAAIAAGWRRRHPEADLVQVPMSDGGPGFLDALHGALGGTLELVTVPDPYAAPVPARVLRVGDTCYLECAEAVGLALTPVAERRPLAGSSRGVGELIAHAVAGGARRVVVGAGGTGTHDGGAGLLAGLGATGIGASLTEGPRGLAGVAGVDLSAARAAVAGVELVLASDVESPLLGLFGATRNFGAQKGLTEDELPRVEEWLQGFAEAVDREVAAEPGAGAAGGIGFALLALGARRVAGVAMVAEVLGLADAVRGADLVITGEGSFDFSSRAGKVVAGVAEAAAQALAPCVVLAGRVQVGSREMRALGIESAHAMVDSVGEERSLSEAPVVLAALAERIARSWDALG